MKRKAICYGCGIVLCSALGRGCGATGTPVMDETPDVTPPADPDGASSADPGNPPVQLPPKTDTDYVLNVVEVEAPMVDLPGGTMKDLSGIAYAGDNRYFVVDDGKCKLRQFIVSIDLNSGQIASISQDPSIVLQNREDCEEVAVHPDGTIYVSDEIEPAVIQHTPADGLQGNALDVPEFIKNEQRTNFGYEALAISADGSSFWAANEGAYKPDGPLSTETKGMSLRLQQWNADRQPTAQYGYVAELIPQGTVAFHAVGGIGIVDMEVTEHGNILVLERTITSIFVNQYELYLFEIQLEGATEISMLPGLEGGVWEPVTKRLLFHRTVKTNFESMTLGPLLENGDRSLLVMSEGLGSDPVLWAFKLQHIPQ